MLCLSLKNLDLLKESILYFGRVIFSPTRNFMFLLNVLRKNKNYFKEL